MNRIDKQSGEGRWQVTYVDGEPTMVEIWLTNGIVEGEKLVVGTRRFPVPCPLCGQETMVCTPDNDEADICEPCYQSVIARMGA